MVCNIPGIYECPDLGLYPLESPSGLRGRVAVCRLTTIIVPAFGRVSIPPLVGSGEDVLQIVRVVVVSVIVFVVHFHAGGAWANKCNGYQRVDVLLSGSAVLTGADVPMTIRRAS